MPLLRASQVLAKAKNCRDSDVHTHIEALHVLVAATTINRRQFTDQFSTPPTSRLRSAPPRPQHRKISFSRQLARVEAICRLDTDTAAVRFLHDPDSPLAS